MSYVSIVGHRLRELWSGGRGPILAAVAGGWFLSIGVRMIYPVLLPHLRAAYGFDLTTAGLLLTVLFVAYGLGQFPGGVLADRLGERAILFASTALSGAALVLIVVADSTAVLFAVTGLFGGGVALYAVARYTLLVDLYPGRVGAANGVVSAAADAGQSVLPPIAGVIATYSLWQYGFAFAIPLFAIVALGLWVVVPAPSAASSDVRKDRSEDDECGHNGDERGRNGDELGAGENPDGGDRADASLLDGVRSVRSGLSSPPVVYGTGLLLLGVTVWQAFTGFYPTYLIEVKGFSGGIASLLFGVFFALGIVVQPVAGITYDRFGIERTILVVMGVAAVGFVAVTMVEGFWPIVAVTVVCSSMLGFATVTQSHLILAIPDRVQGTGFGVLRTISFTIGAASPVVFGAAGDRGYFDEAFIGLAVLAMVAVLLASVTPPAGGSEDR